MFSVHLLKWVEMSQTLGELLSQWTVKAHGVLPGERAHTCLHACEHSGAPEPRSLETHAM